MSRIECYEGEQRIFLIFIPFGSCEAWRLNWALKALVNEDTSLPMMFLGVRKLGGNICCGHKMFLNKIRNIFCVPDAKFVSAANVARASRRGNIFVGNNVSSLARALSVLSNVTETNDKVAEIPKQNPPLILLVGLCLTRYQT